MTWSLTLAGLPRAGAHSKPHDYKQKYKKWSTFRKWVSRKNSLKISDEKKYISSLDQTTPRNTRPINATNEGGPCNQKELNSTKLKKKTKFRSKQLELCKTRTKKSSPDLFKVYVVLAGHDMITDNDSSTKCRSIFKAPSLKTNEKWKTFRKDRFHLITIWRF